MATRPLGNPRARADQAIRILADQEQPITVQAVRQIAGVRTELAAEAVKDHKLRLERRPNVSLPRPNNQVLEQLWRAACDEVLHGSYFNEYMRQSEALIADLVSELNADRGQIERDYETTITKLVTEVEYLKNENSHYKAIVDKLIGAGDSDAK